MAWVHSPARRESPPGNAPGPSLFASPWLLELSTTQLPGAWPPLREGWLMDSELDFPLPHRCSAS